MSIYLGKNQIDINRNVGQNSMIRITILGSIEGLTATVSQIGSDFTYTGTVNNAGIINIPVPSFGNYTITYNNIRVHGWKNATVISNMPVDVVAQYNEIIHYRLRIDETNSNPETACTYLEDAQSMTKGSTDWDNLPIFNDIKPCVFKDGAVNYYLQKNNFNLKEDGTPSTLTGEDGDVMIEFCKFGYKITREDNYLYVDLTNDENAEGYCYDAFSRLTKGDLDKFYQGAYKGYIDDNGYLRSIAGVLPTANKNIGEFRTAAQRRNTVDGAANTYHYQQATYAHLVALQCLYLMKYGNRNGQVALGRGIVSASNTYVTGYNAENLDAVTDSLSTAATGMDYGTTANSTTHMKLFGIEDFWGCIWEWVDGFTTDANRNIITSWNSFSGEPVEEITSTTTPSGLTANANEWNKRVAGNSQAGFMPVKFGGSSSTFWADRGALYASCVLCFGGRQADGDYAGPFRLDAADGASSRNASVGARLSYN